MHTVTEQCGGRTCHTSMLHVRDDLDRVIANLL